MGTDGRANNLGTERPGIGYEKTEVEGVIYTQNVYSRKQIENQRTGPVSFNPADKCSKCGLIGHQFKNCPNYG